MSDYARRKPGRCRHGNEVFCKPCADDRERKRSPSVPVPREVLERVRGALAALLREEPLVYEGNLEAKLYVTVDALTDSRIALADLDRLLNE